MDKKLISSSYLMYSVESFSLLHGSPDFTSSEVIDADLTINMVHVSLVT